MEIYFVNGTLDYTTINKTLPSNSYLENYNKRIKLKLSKYLFGRSKTKISWPVFNYFVIKEENDYRWEIIKNESEIQKKIKLTTMIIMK